jgi:hypothetical protein
MLLHLCLRNLRHNLSRYLLASAGIFLAVVLTSSAMSGVAAARRAGVEALRASCGGDIMIASGDLDILVTQRGITSSLTGLRSFDASSLIGRLNEEDFVTVETLVVPVFEPDRPNVRATLIGRSAGDPGPAPPMIYGRFLGPEDAALPHMVAPYAHQASKVGVKVRIRVPSFLGSDSGSESATGLGRVTVGVPSGSQASLGEGVWDFSASRDVEFEVVGVYEQPAIDVPFVPLDYLQSVTGCHQVLWVGVLVPDENRLAAVAERVRQLAPDLTVLTTEDVLEMLDVEAAEIRRSGLTIMLLVLGVGSLAVLSTTLLLARMRRREVALMKVLGFSGAEVAFTFMFETLLATGLGAVAGYFVGSLIGSGAARQGFGITWVSLAYVVGLAMVVTLLGTIFPAFWMARYSAMEAMRNV